MKIDWLSHRSFAAVPMLGFGLMLRSMQAFHTTRKTLGADLVLAGVLSLGAAVTFLGAQAQAFPQDPPCPTDALAPFGISPGPNAPDPNNRHCANNGCLVSFAGYQWWTAFQYVGPYYNNSYYYNGGLGTAFAPEHAYALPGGGDLVLRVGNDIDLGAGPVWAGGEAVLMFNSDGTEANLGYGDYLVVAEFTTPDWADLDPNLAFGMFTYERYGPPPSDNSPWPSRGGSYNPYREIDLAEISRWGWDHTGDCPAWLSGYAGKFNLSTLCKGNAQFATQDYTQSALSVMRYDVGTNQDITLVMRWHDGNQPVAFEKYSGNFTLETLPLNPTPVTWMTPPTDPNFKTTTLSQLNNFIPNDPNTPPSCERFHINFWFGNSQGHPPPSNGQAQEVHIKNFQFCPLGGCPASRR